jgi:hypothetical protein
MDYAGLIFAATSQAEHSTKLHVTSEALKGSAQHKQVLQAQSQYHELKRSKRELRGKITKLQEAPKDEATQKLLEKTKAQLADTHKAATELKARFQSLYYLEFGGTHESYVNDPTHPGVRDKNARYGMMAPYGFVVNPNTADQFRNSDGAQQCSDMQTGLPQCPEVLVAGTCNDNPSYSDCDGDSCAYYSMHPEECGLHDHHCGDDEDQASLEYDISSVCEIDSDKLHAHTPGEPMPLLGLPVPGLLRMPAPRHSWWLWYVGDVRGAAPEGRLGRSAGSLVLSLHSESV